MSETKEIRDQTVRMVVDTAEVVGHLDWVAQNGVAAADICQLGRDRQGAEFYFELWAPEGSDPEADAQRVAVYWESLGMEVSVTDTTPRPTVYGSGGPVLRASFDTGAADNSYSVGAVAECIPGDYFELNVKDDEARAHGRSLPGDEYLPSKVRQEVEK